MDYIRREKIPGTKSLKHDVCKGYAGIPDLLDPILFGGELAKFALAGWSKGLTPSESRIVQGPRTLFSVLVNAQNCRGKGLVVPITITPSV